MGEIHTCSYKLKPLEGTGEHLVNKQAQVYVKHKGSYMLTPLDGIGAHLCNRQGQF